MTIGRPLAYDPDEVLDTAMHLFWRQGYEATSVQELMTSMKLSKSSLYQAFGSKHQLFLLCIDHYHEMTMADLQARLAGCPTALEFIAETLHQVATQDNELTNPRGCLVTNTATEFSQSDTDVARRVRKGLDGYQSIFRAAAVKGLADGSIRKDWDPDVLAHYLVTGMSGLRTMVKGGIEPAVLRQTVAVMEESVK